LRLFLKETLLGNHRLVRQMQRESPHFLVDDTLAGLAARMNALTASHDVDPAVLQATADAFDANFANGATSCTTTTRFAASCMPASGAPTACAPARRRRCSSRGAGPYIAIRMQLITRKSLGGLQTDLKAACSTRSASRSPGCTAWARRRASAAAAPTASARWRAPSCRAASSPPARRRGRSPARADGHVSRTLAATHHPEDRMSSTARLNGAQALMKTLADAGVDVCFTNPGTSEMHFVAALDGEPRMRAVLALFEGVATGAADGYARMADKPAATLLHLGCGLGNGLANLHNARKGKVPVLNIVGDHATSHAPYDAQLQSDIETVARNVSPGFVRTSRATADLCRDAVDALAAARGLPGQVATLILPADVSWGDGGVPAAPVPPPRLRRRCRHRVSHRRCVAQWSQNRAAAGRACPA
jgi:sulfopyruvate decarboxylase TPP-binding subunit